MYEQERLKTQNRFGSIRYNLEHSYSLVNRNWLWTKNKLLKRLNQTKMWFFAGYLLFCFCKYEKLKKNQYLNKFNNWMWNKTKNQ